ncbi:DUF397 domain-containing protein [Actinomadura sp. LD22]|uniref:DUF397 domain-containing protein n=1 Tax=Actinomadura physcomitrii TaxID=2650748 RepID=A0A6I4M741_9ACTN|nr:DUF397 domain-containing protein [Actinomadura physcomitrii]MWA01968.1 DUF397 domain-containing protein [Actinomadura physcomitrii]
MDRNALNWRKSSLSGNNGGDCVEVAVVRGRDCEVANKVDEEFVVLVRDSKNRDREPQVFTVAEWDAFLAGVRQQEFDSARLIAEYASPVAVS